jgi:DNA repair exonuclease SbcCD ATPase subunit
MNAPTSLIPLVEANPAMVLLEPVKFDQFYDEVAREVRSHVPDLTTNKGREAIASLAMKVSKTKTAIDDARKGLTEDARAQIKKVDEQGKVIRDKLDALRDEVKQPLVEWRAAEDERIAACQRVIDGLKRDGLVTGEDTTETVVGRLDLVRAVEITAERFQEFEDLAKTLRDNAIQSLEAGAERLRIAEEERAELARLRAAEEERQRQAEEDRRLAEARALAEQAEQERKDAEARAVREAEDRAEAERRRIAEAAAAAERAATEAAARAAEESRRAQEQAHEEALDAERRRTQEAEAARQAEIDRAAAAEAQRLADLKAEADAQAAREADVAHKSQIMGAAKDALIALGLTEPKAKAVVMAIKAGEVPNVSIRF